MRPKGHQTSIEWTQIVLKVNDKKDFNAARERNTLFKGMPIMADCSKRNFSGQERIG